MRQFSESEGPFNIAIISRIPSACGVSWYSCKIGLNAKPLSLEEALRWRKRINELPDDGKTVGAFIQQASDPRPCSRQTLNLVLVQSHNRAAERALAALQPQADPVEAEYQAFLREQAAKEDPQEESRLRREARAFLLGMMCGAHPAA